ncbi:ileal sodium/bile acid cotransporter-like [Amphiura filiformis]|uniref:ileal sodium/bile acid cotransporter-like n=1 Tax=Amphiura filiformis TaxID=82378 RepID=UPI003B21C5BE
MAKICLTLILAYMATTYMVSSQAMTNVTDEPIITMTTVTELANLTTQADPSSTLKITEGSSSPEMETGSFESGDFNYTYGAGFDEHIVFWRGKLVRNLTINSGEIGGMVSWNVTNPKALVLPAQLPTSFNITSATRFPHDLIVVLGGRYPGSADLVVVYTPPGSDESMEIGRTEVACHVGQGRLNTVATYIFIIWLIISYVTMGCKMNIDVIKSKLKPPTGVIIGMICQFLIMPALAYGIAKMFNLSSELSVGLILVGTCPGGWISNVLTVLLDCDFVLSLTMTAFSTVIAMAMMPLNLFIYVDTILGVDKNLQTPYVELVVQLLLLVIPLGVGVGLAYKWPKLENRADKLMKPFATILVLIAVGLGIPTQIYIFFVEVNGWITSLLLPFVGAFFGLAFARILNQNYRASTTIAFETACQNALLAKTMANLFYPKPESDLIGILPLLVAVLTALEGLFAAFIYTIVIKCKDRYRERHADADDNVELQGVQRNGQAKTGNNIDMEVEKEDGGVTNPNYTT